MTELEYFKSMLKLIFEKEVIKISVTMDAKNNSTGDSEIITYITIDDDVVAKQSYTISTFDLPKKY